MRCWSRLCMDCAMCCPCRPTEQNLFGIVQGGLYPDLRRISAAQLVERNLPGWVQDVSLGPCVHARVSMHSIFSSALPGYGDAGHSSPSPFELTPNWPFALLSSAVQLRHWWPGRWRVQR